MHLFARLFAPFPIQQGTDPAQLVGQMFRRGFAAVRRTDISRAFGYIGELGEILIQGRLNGILQLLSALVISHENPFVNF